MAHFQSVENPDETKPKGPATKNRLKRIQSFPLRLGRFVRTSHRDNVLFLASALSFDALLAAIPLALLFIALIGFVLQGRSSADIGSVLQLVLPIPDDPSAGNPMAQAERIIETVIGSRGQLSLYGLPLFMLFSTRLFASIRIALNQILHIQVHRGFFTALGVDLVLVVITTALFAANSVVSIPVFGFTYLDQLLGHVLGVAFGTILFFLVYSIAPDESMEWDTALIAASVVSVGFEVAKFFYTFYLANVATINQLISHANAVAIILFVFWIYYSMLIFLLGAEVAKIHLRHKQSVRRRSAALLHNVSD